jgi:uncharacterized protein YabE (DUF348 family)
MCDWSKAQVRFLALFSICILFAFPKSILTFFLLQNAARSSFAQAGKRIVIVDGGLSFSTRVKADTAEQALNEAGINLAPQDKILPARFMPIAEGTRIIIRRQRQVTLILRGEKRTLHTFARSVGELLAELEFAPPPSATLSLSPPPPTPLAEKTVVTIREVVVKQIRRRERIAPPLKYQPSPSLPLGETKLVNPGKFGWREKTYALKYIDGKLTQRKLLKSRTITSPRPRIFLRGTRVEVLARQFGIASWYHAPAGTAAHPSYPPGSKLRVTSLAHKRSVIVKVREQGPFTPGRIVDLSAPSFSKLAPLTKGTIKVRVELLR